MENLTADTQDGAAQSAAGATGIVIDLKPSLEIKDVEVAHRSLIEALAKGVPLTIDLTQIAAIDTAGVQLLMGFQIAAEKRGTPLSFAGESAVFAQALNVLGLRESFNTAGCRG